MTRKAFSNLKYGLMFGPVFLLIILYSSISFFFKLATPNNLKVSEQTMQELVKKTSAKQKLLSFKK